MNRPRVILFGYGDLARAIYHTVEAAGGDVTAAVIPSNRSGTDVERFRSDPAVGRRRLLVQPPRRALDPFLDALRAEAPDFIVVASYSMILPGAVLAIARHGAVNVHGGLLPAYRGGHVMQWAILNGERETGVTLHYMDEGIDTGPIIAQTRFPIGPDDDAVIVKQNVQAAATSLMRDWWPRIADRTAPRVPQDETTARLWPMRTTIEGRICWSEPARAVCRLVRAMASNVPGAYIEDEARTISILRARPVDETVRHAEPGRALGLDADGLRIAAGTGAVVIAEAIVDGRTLSGVALGEITGAFARC
jgi:methionyl-tRNA formyltransferase